MARQIAKSFIEQKRIDPKHLAQSFTDEYFREPWRGYGGSVVEVFKKLRNSECGDPYKPASEQFSGTGSYGNKRHLPSSTVWSSRSGNVRRSVQLKVLFSFTI